MGITVADVKLLEWLPWRRRAARFAAEQATWDVCQACGERGVWAPNAMCYWCGEYQLKR